MIVHDILKLDVITQQWETIASTNKNFMMALYIVEGLKMQHLYNCYAFKIKSHYGGYKMVYNCQTGQTEDYMEGLNYE